MAFSRLERGKNAQRRPGALNMRTVSGWGTILLCVTALIIPVNYVTEVPGPTFNTIGEYSKRQLIDIEGTKTYPVTGRLDMTTVSVAGGPDSTVSALGVLATWLESSTTVLPSDLVYSPSLTGAEVSAANSAQMTNSQEVAQAAALKFLNIGYDEHLKVSGTVEGSPSEGLVLEGDLVRSIDGIALKDYQSLVDTLNEAKEREVILTVERDGQDVDIPITPIYNAETDRYALGLYITRTFDFPFTVNYGLEEVGGPSAGMMFALGIIDELNEQDMTGGKHFAGTGTIEVDGTVGSIGGIAQKMKGAADRGASVFLAPAANCDEVVGNIPDNLSVVKVETLSEAAQAVTAIGKGADPSIFPTCTAG